MNNLKTAAFILSAFALSFSEMKGDDASVRIESFKLSPDVILHLPALPSDTIDRKNNQFSNDMMLTAVNRKASRVSADWTEVSADSAGMIRLPKADDTVRLKTLATRLQPSRFVKGKIKLKSNVIASLSEGDNQLISFPTPDSVASWKEASISLQPFQTAELRLTSLSLPDDPRAPELALEFVPDAGYEDIDLAISPEVKPRFLAQQSALGTRVRNVSISPDGKYIIVGYYTFYGEGRSNFTAELRECASGRIVNANIPTDAKWLDKGSTLYYSRKTDNLFSLIALDAASQKQTVLAEDLPDNNFVVSPNAEYLIFYKFEEGKKEDGPLKRIIDPDDRLPGFRDRYYLEKYNIQSGVTQPLTFAGNSNYVNCISPDSKKLIYSASFRRPAEYPFYFQNVIEMDVETLKTDTLIKSMPYIGSITYSPDAKKLFITAGPEAFSGVGKNNGGKKYSNEYDVQGFLFDIASKSVTPMTKDFIPGLEGSPQWNRADGKIYFRATDGFNQNVYSLNPNSGEIAPVELDMPYVYAFSVGADNPRWLAAAGEDFTYAGRAELLDLKTGKQSVIADPYAEDFPELATGEMKPWNFQASDGTVIDCMQVFPPDFDPEKKYPMIVYYYGGCSPTQKRVSIYDPQLFASRGYVTLVINPSGAYGYGQEFSSRHANAWGKRTAEDIIEGVEKYCSSHPFVDDKKVGCLGASYGGFMTQYLQTLTDKFAAAVSHAGISDVTSYWGEGFWGYSYNAVAAPESYPWNNPELFTRQGSLFNADKIHTPLLLLHGNVDTNVPVGESIQLFNALRILGREVEFIQVDGENHYISNYDKRLQWHAAIMAWFAKHLQDAPQWWEEMYPEP